MIGECSLAWFTIELHTAILQKISWDQFTESSKVEFSLKV